MSLYNYIIVGDVQIGNINNERYPVLIGVDPVTAANIIYNNVTFNSSIFVYNYTIVGAPDVTQNISTMNQTFSNWIATLNATLNQMPQRYNTTEEMIRAVNSTGYVINWSQFMGSVVNTSCNCIPTSDWYIAVYSGSIPTGVDGGLSRNLTVTAEQISIDGYVLHNGVDFNISGGTVCFYNSLWNDMKIAVFYNTDVVAVNMLGSNLSGASGTSGRTYSVSNLKSVIVDNYLLHPVDDYQYAAGTLTFSHNIWNDEVITLFTNGNMTFSNQYGSATTGSSGDVNRELTIPKPNMISVDGYVLLDRTDYNYSDSKILFKNPLWDDMRVTLWY